VNAKFRYSITSLQVSELSSIFVLFVLSVLRNKHVGIEILFAPAFTHFLKRCYNIGRKRAKNSAKSTSDRIFNPF